MADTCNTCSPNQDGLFGRIIGGDLLNPPNVYEFVDGVDTKAVVTELPNGKIQVTFNYAPYTAPTASMSVSPTVFEVGDTVASANFSLSVTERSEPITSISVNPDPGITLNPGGNTWSVVNVTSNVASNSVALHTASITDGTTNLSRSAALSARWRYYQGYSTKTSLNETEIKALVNSNISTGIKTIYGGTNNYTIPSSAVNQYIYWCYPEGTAGIQSLKSGIFDVPFQTVGNVTVINAFGIEKTYIVIRTTNAFGSGNLEITMN